MKGPLLLIAAALLIRTQAACTYGDVRLVGGTSQYEGRVEVCINNAWGTVCDDLWNSPDATVVCRQLGYATTGSGVARINAYFGQGTGQIVLDDVQCSGSENQLLACISAPILTVSRNCYHFDDAGVSCEEPCTTGQLRLVEGNIQNEGRVEICMSSVWGTVCDDSWSTIDAAVVCRQLGYSTEDVVAFSGAHFGAGTGTIHLDDVGCTGSENSLIDCSRSSTVYCYRGHSEDAGVRCQVNSSGNCTYGDVRLVGGSNQYEGRVEVCINDQWGTVCGDGWDSVDATVICKQLGFATTGSGVPYSYAFFGAGTGPIFLDDVACTSSASQLLECSSRPILTHNCLHSRDAGVRCKAPCTPGQLQLAGGNIPNEGRVEICISTNLWGTVCDDYWSSIDATVVCRQLGYSTQDAVAFSGAHFGVGTGTIYLDDVACTGSETNLTSCSRSSSVYCYRGHSEDAGVRCQVIAYGNCTYGDVRLVGGSNQYEGRVEVCINDQWGTVCDDSWDSVDATVVCKQLRYATTGSGVAYSNAHFGAGTGPIYLDDVVCTSSANQLLECSSRPILSHSCRHSEDAGVGCKAPCTPGQLQLAGGNIPNEGRVEICIRNNVWGTVCDDSWSSTDATVVCRQLGYSIQDAVAFSGAHFGAGAGTIYLDEVDCTGSETTLIDCPRGSSVYCRNGHAEDAGVRCQVNASGNCTYGDVRLAGGSNQYEGRVEVCINDQWGTVCHDGWDTTDATVVCTQLGYATTGYGLAYYSAHFGAGTGPIYLDDVACSSSASQLLECSSRPILTHNCLHSADAGVGCKAPCTTGQLQLVGGNIPNEGRVEICIFNNVWSTVCDDGWSSTDATVVCRQLGYSTQDAVAFGNAHFGTGTGAIYLDEVSCTGSEAKLADCPRIYSVYCRYGHSEDAGVRCQVNASGNCTYGDVRLVGGSNQYEGRVEVCINDQWGTVCDDGWDTVDATVVCKQLGYAIAGSGIAYSNGFFGAGTGPIYLDDVACTSSASQLLECSSRPILTHNCLHSADAGVGCEAPCTPGQLQLAGANIPNEGRVEICITNNVWGTVCDDGWSSTDATVVCRQLGYSTQGSVAFSNAHFGAGTGTIYLDNVGCTGSENNLIDCSRSSTVSCSHSEDAGIRCQVYASGNCTYGDVRLVGGSNQYEGRVEVCINDQWGTVCDDSWDSVDATVVCRQLGYAYTGSGVVYSNAFFGAGTGPIYLDDVACTSSSTQLLECSSRPILTHNCLHSADAGVGCEAACRTGQLRLMGGNIPNEGRVEICMNNVWGTVCDDLWSSTDATVVCRQLGYSTQDAVAFSNAHFGAGTGTIYLDDVGCTGSETNLIDCSRSSTVRCSRGHLDDAGVRCQVNASGNCTYGDVHLVGGSNEYEGRVEVCINDQWGTVCHDGWDTTDATVVCKQLGYATTGYGLVYRNAFFGAGTGPIYLDDVACTSSASQLLECSSRPILTHNCLHSEDAGVGCKAPCTSGQLQLAGGNIPNEGRVEICMSTNVWGTVCDDSWSSTDATVVCRQLGYSTEDAVAFSNAHFGVGTGTIYLDNVGCTGSETNLINCPRSSTVYCRYGHSEDAGVRCQVIASGNCTYGDVRLVGGSNQYEGRVEVCINDQWGTVCDDGWSSVDASVVCKQLGYATTGSGIAYYNAHFGAGTGPIYLDDVACTSSASQLLECSSRPILTHNCLHSRDAGVGCKAPCTAGQLQLVGGNIPNEGRVEVCIFNNVWSTVCDDYWDSIDATVVCRQLGYSTQDAVAFSGAHFSTGTGTIYLDNVACTGSETNLTNCPRSSSVYCRYGHSEDAGVRCQVTASGNCTYGDVRLVGGSNQYEGTVEVCINDQWGTVCHDGWDSVDASMVCKQLGYATTGSAVAYYNARFGAGTGPIYLDDVACTSSASQLLECSSRPILTHNCLHSADAGVGCEVPCTTGQLRLVGGIIPNEGRVEICMNNVWGTVCDDLWSSTDATVVCRQLGYSIQDAVAFSNAHFGAGTGTIHLDDVGCTGSETNLIDCSRSSTVRCSRSHLDDAGVRCQVNASGNCTYGDVRLVGGSSQYEGRVEVCINNQWGTVCDDGWSTIAATVVCKQLGYAYTGSGVAFSNAFFGAGTGPIYLDDVACTSSASQLLECSSRRVLSHNCLHSADAGVRCDAPCTMGQLRLVGGNIPNEGRVEICMNNVWGTVCDDLWSSIDATVVCRQLGYSTQDAVAFSNAHFGPGTGTIYLDDVGCSGRETNLTDCPRSSSVYCYRGHSEDAGVRCQVNASGNCTYGDVRLVGGSNQYEGRVEVCINDQWGTVCDDSWDTTDATVVCKQLGYATTGSGLAYSNARFGSGTGSIFLDDVVCTSSASQLLECSSRPILTHSCTHSEDAGVRCNAPCTPGQLQLAGGNIPNEGRVEICISTNLWGTVCDDYWSSIDATVVCRQLGYSTQDAVAFSRAHFGVGTGTIYLDNVGCTGSETNLTSCPRSSSVYCRYGHSEDAGVRCQVISSGNCTYGDVRLVGGSSQYEGRVEVCINDQWGTVCDNSWDSVDATVVCKQLGYATTGSGVAYINAHFGAGTGPIYLDTVACTSSASQLLECSSRPILTHYCTHFEDAGVGCKAPCTPGQLQLAGGNIPNEGRVEICISTNVWGTVCDDSWSSIDATVVCRQLGYSTQDAVAFSNAHFGAGTGAIHLDNVGCTGSETNLTSCPRSSSVYCYRGHSEDAGVRCQVIASGNCTYGDIRLVGGSNQYEGRVEVCINDQWGTVCDDSWSSVDATVVCKQLGYAYTGSGVAYSNAYFGAGTGPIFLDDVQCTSSASQLLECSSRPILTHNCLHSADAGVKCEGPCTTGGLRLAGGNIPNEGRVEICINNVWGTVCDDLWSSTDATVVCRQLGYSTQDAVAFSNAHFGAGTGAIYLDDVGCTGSETNLIDCSRSSTVRCSRGHLDDAGVRCQVNASGNCTYGDVRLVGGSNQYEGRVEVCINDQWGTVCGHFWDSVDATVVCKQLGYATTGSGVGYSYARFGAGTGPIYMDDVACTSSASQLLECSSRPILTHNCLHSTDAGVGCKAPCATGQLQLAGGNIPNEGRVEICISTNLWGTVCDDSWSSTDATVVCRQLGYPTQDAVAFGNALFGAGTGTIYLDEVACTGSETNLIDCSRSSSVYCYRGHSEDAGVRCQVIANGSTCFYGDVRLVGGSNQYEGRVEVCINDQWGTVCHDGWDATDATVVCKQLGYATTGSAVAYSNAFFGAGTGPIYLDDVACTSSASQLLECSSRPILTHNCLHSRDAGVGCKAPCTPGQLQLAGGNIPNEGRVEICIRNNLWGTVCDDLWSSTDATVVCRQLGYSTQDAVAFSGAHFGAGTGTIYLDNVGCTGSENNLIDCPRSSTVSCSHSEDAGVRCQVIASGNCTYGDVHLVGGSNQYEGRVEVCINDQWGTVCHDGWDSVDASVVCKQLGYATTGNGIPYYNAHFGAGTGPIFLDDVACSSSASQLLECSSRPILQHNCAHSADAGVGCKAPCTTGQLQLVGGSIPNEGRVEICIFSGVWSTVCDDSWSNTDATVVCRQLGYSTQDAVAFSGARFGTGTGLIYLDEVGCTGSEAKLADCYRSSTVYCRYSHSEDAGVRCQVSTSGNCTYGDVRLVGGSNQYEGRVEVCINDQWGTVCHDGWDSVDASVVCKQLGYATTGSGIAYYNAHFGAGTGPIYLDDVACTSSASQLLECSSRPILTHNCIHSRDAGVGCAVPCATGQLRLVGGNIPNEGRVEICIDNVWGTVCDDLWDSTDATVVCRQLGYSTQDAVAFSGAHFGVGIGTIHLDDVRCSGSEMDLIDCSRASSVYCYRGHSEDAGVRCQVNTSGNCTYGDVRLLGGSNRYEGRVEVCINDQWGTVCDDSWDTIDATVVCKQLGYATTGSGTAYSNAHFGAGTGPIYLDDVACTSSASQLLECSSRPILTHNCRHSDDAGIGCKAPCTTGQLQLAGGNIPNEGRVEICIRNNVWGTVCDDSWDSTDATVVCRQLGYSTQDAVAFSGAHFGIGAGTIYLDDVGCTGQEINLTDCPRSSSVYCRFAHSEDAGVRCQVNASGNCNYGDVRLVGGSNQYEGRVEVCINEQWGTVCDDSWSSVDANVVCRQLGYAYTGSAVAYGSAFFGQGTGPIFLDEVQCSSSASQLLECSSRPVLSHNCFHSDDAGVKCEAPCAHGQLRLVGGNIVNEGRVEICMNNVWGTVCDDSWGNTDATVVCRQLGFSTIDAVAFSRAHFGAGTGTIYLDNVGCTGSETNLIDCSRNSTVTCYSGHSEDAGVRCQVSASGNCSNGDLQLVGGSSQYEGRVEICTDYQWGTVCDDNWDNTDATVVCRQLGYAYTGTGQAFTGAYFGAGTGPIFLDDVHCNSSATRLLHCTSNPIASHNCAHSDDAGVRCEALCVNGQLRLEGGNIPNEGRVEICMNNVWGTVCDDLWSSDDATVVCRQLDYSAHNAVAYGNAHFGAGVGLIYLNNVGCTGAETSLLQCSYTTASSCTNAHSEDAGVRCQVISTGNCTYGDVRLVGGSNQYEGRVEVCINDQWGTVCDDGWSSIDATVVCKQLGYAYTGSGQAFANAYFGEGIGSIFLDDVQCSPNTASILQCPSNPIGAHNCNHSDDAGVRCEPPCTTGEPRLVSGNVENEGRVEICINGAWLTICDTEWDGSDAAVVCRQLGHLQEGAVAFNNAHFGAGIGSVFLNSVNCSGTETGLLGCYYRTSSSGCSHSEDAGVRCQVNATGNCTYGDVRLVGGSNQYEGRVEVCINDQWGTVCDDSWSSVDASVVCRQLGYAYTGSGKAYSNAWFGAGTGPIFLDDVQCSSSASQLLECSSRPILSHDCLHSADASVGCEAPCSTGQLRLVGGNIPNEGRVEICMNNVWGTVCDESWGSADATVVCRQLGYSTEDAVAFSNAHFGAGTGTIYLSNVACTGNETNLINCPQSSTVNCTYGHSEDAGVRCQVTSSGNCTYGDIRLVGGSNQYEGRVEVCINDQWGTVCDDGWDSVDATVVCKQLGFAYTGTGRAFGNAYFGAGTGPIFLDEVQCSSSASQLLECSSRPIASHDCLHTADGGVGCEAPCTTGQLRLVGGNTINEGRVEICFSNVWGTVCDDGWSTTDAAVVCGQLGYSSTGAVAFNSSHFGAGIGSVFLKLVNCIGTETELLDCSYSTRTSDCSHSDDAGLRCQLLHIVPSSSVTTSTTVPGLVFSQSTPHTAIVPSATTTAPEHATSFGTLLSLGATAAPRTTSTHSARTAPRTISIFSADLGTASTPSAPEATTGPRRSTTLSAPETTTAPGTTRISPAPPTTAAPGTTSTLSAPPTTAAPGTTSILSAHPTTAAPGTTSILSAHPTTAAPGTTSTLPTTTVPRTLTLSSPGTHTAPGTSTLSAPAITAPGITPTPGTTHRTISTLSVTRIIAVPRATPTLLAPEATTAPGTISTLSVSPTIAAASRPTPTLSPSAVPRTVLTLSASTTTTPLAPRPTTAPRIISTLLAPETTEAPRTSLTLSVSPTTTLRALPTLSAPKATTASGTIITLPAPTTTTTPGTASTLLAPGATTALRATSSVPPTQFASSTTSTLPVSPATTTSRTTLAVRATTAPNTITTRTSLLTASETITPGTTLTLSASEATAAVSYLSATTVSRTSTLLQTAVPRASTLLALGATLASKTTTATASPTLPGASTSTLPAPPTTTAPSISPLLAPNATSTQKASPTTTVSTQKASPTTTISGTLTLLAPEATTVPRTTFTLAASEVTTPPRTTSTLSAPEETVALRKTSTLLAPEATAAPRTTSTVPTPEVIAASRTTSTLPAPEATTAASTTPTLSAPETKIAPSSTSTLPAPEETEALSKTPTLLAPEATAALRTTSTVPPPEATTAPGTTPTLLAPEGTAALRTTSTVPTPNATAARRTTSTLLAPESTAALRTTSTVPSPEATAAPGTTSTLLAPEATAALRTTSTVSTPEATAAPGTTSTLLAPEATAALRTTSTVPTPEATAARQTTSTLLAPEATAALGTTSTVPTPEATAAPGTTPTLLAPEATAALRTTSTVSTPEATAAPGTTSTLLAPEATAALRTTSTVPTPEATAARRTTSTLLAPEATAALRTTSTVSTPEATAAPGTTSTLLAPEATAALRTTSTVPTPEATAARRTTSTLLAPEATAALGTTSTVPTPEATAAPGTTPTLLAPEATAALRTTSTVPTPEATAAPGTTPTLLAPEGTAALRTTSTVPTPEATAAPGTTPTLLAPEGTAALRTTLTPEATAAPGTTPTLLAPEATAALRTTSTVPTPEATAAPGTTPTLLAPEATAALRTTSTVPTPEATAAPGTTSTLLAPEGTAALGTTSTQPAPEATISPRTMSTPEATIAGTPNMLALETTAIPKTTSTLTAPAEATSNQTTPPTTTILMTTTTLSAPEAIATPRTSSQLVSEVTAAPETTLTLSASEIMETPRTTSTLPAPEATTAPGTTTLSAPEVTGAPKTTPTQPARETTTAARKTSTLVAPYVTAAPRTTSTLPAPEATSTHTAPQTTIGGTSTLSAPMITPTLSAPEATATPGTSNRPALEATSTWSAAATITAPRTTPTLIVPSIATAPRTMPTFSAPAPMTIPDVTTPTARVSAGITETTHTSVSSTSSVAVLLPTCLPSSSQSATANTMVAILHDYTNSQFTDVTEANFKTSTKQIINTYCSTYTHACVSTSSLSTVPGTACMTIIRTADNRNGRLAVTFFVSFSGSVLDSETVMTALQAGITNGDYEAAGFSGQLDVVSLDTYNESESPTSGPATGQDLIRVIVPIITTIIIVLLLATIILIILIIRNRTARNYSPNAASKSPVTSSAPTTIDQKLELGNPDLSTVIENKTSDILPEDTTL